MARDPSRDGCAIESRERGELLLGTASRVPRWLLIEQPGAWGREALTESHLPGGIATSLGRRAEAAGVRVVLIRRSAAPTPVHPATAYFVHTGQGHRWAERITFDDPHELHELDLTAPASGEPPGIGELVTDPLHLVCTNGRHDPCCADFGRPVHRTLSQAGIDAWECSHIGGDRFAANVVCLPTGVYFGRVPPDQAARIIRDHDAGLLELANYRGRCHLAPMVQAAEVFARLEMGERRIDQLDLIRSRRDGERAVVRLAHVDGDVEVEVVRRRGIPEQLTCGDPTSTPWEHRMVAFRAV